ncbi:diguanylate cyclase domain-containing protein [Acidovorax sp. BL-A-41-H1]|uniref:GGDEF domain-containing protein n=1 Tax=Acidovorax sp. BL-A-41-H1 TaxID=3421102 RepID=UPI003F79FAD3
MPTERHRLIRMLFDEYIAMYAHRDARLLSRFGDGFSGFTGSGDEIVKERSRWVDLTLEDFAVVPGHIRIEMLDFHPQDLAPDLVAATGFFHIHLPEPDVSFASQTARLVLVFRLEAADDWKIVHSSISIPHGTAAPGNDATLDELYWRNRDLQVQLDERTKALAEVKARSEQVAHTDALTGLPNRRHFDAMLAAGWAHAQRAAAPLALVMMDADAFKSFNTHYGRLAGDSCLQALATALSQAAAQDPRGAVAARWEGDVFMVLMPGSDGPASLSFAQTVHAAIDALALPHEGSAQGRVTASLGVASMVALREQPPQDLLRAADRALRQAKQRGGHCIEVAPGSSPAD